MKFYAYALLLFIPLFSFAQIDLIDSIAKGKINQETKNPVESILLYFEDYDKNVIYNKAFGKQGQGLQMVSKNDQFRIASSTKLFIATIILQLEQEGKLKVDDKISTYLKNIDYLDFSNLHIYKEKSYSNDITIEQLLSHRSGLADIFSDRQEAFFKFLMQNPNRQHTPESIVALYYQFNLNNEPHFEPGNGWHYSDMNYVLLGKIIETIEQKILPKSIRKRILTPLNMEDTFFEFYEPILKKKHQVNQFVGNINFSEINTSFDWSGGGLVSTNKDLAVFIKSLFDLKLIYKASLNKMIDVKFTQEHENRYGLGIYESEYNGNTYFGHYGFYGTYVGYCPKTNSVISYSIGQATPDFNVHSFINEILKLKPN